jgi:hypothetical protein
LGVTLCPDLRFGEHISKVLAACNQRLYLICQLKKQGLPVFGTETVFNALVLGKILYALPMFYNYLTEHNKNQIRALFKKAKRWQLVHTEYDLDSLAEKSMFSLFKQSTSEFHSLNHLYTCNRNERFSTLRKRGHNYITPAFKYDITSKNFILYCLNHYRYLP